MSLSQDQIDALLKRELNKVKAEPKGGNAKPLSKLEERLGKYDYGQVGPLRYVDATGYCIAGFKGHRCNSEAHYRIQGLFYCGVHALKLLNEMLVAKGVLG